MSIVPIDFDAVRASMNTAAASVAGLLRDITDPTMRVPGLDWTAGELGAHLVTEARRFERFANGGNDAFPVDGVADYNAYEIEQIEETDPRKLADLFEAAHATFAEHASKQRGADPFTWFDLKITWAQACCVYLGEMQVHALDLSRTLGRKWKIPAADAINIAYGLLPILPSFVDPAGSKGFKGSFKLKLRGGQPVVLSFNDGDLTVSGDGRADCTISANPEAFLLVGYGRASQWGPILRGKILASGRKPWLGLRFATLLRNP